MKIKEIIKKAKNGQKQILREKDFYLEGKNHLENRQIYQEIIQLVNQGKIFPVSFLAEHIRKLKRAC